MFGTVIFLIHSNSAPYIGFPKQGLELNYNTLKTQFDENCGVFFAISCGIFLIIEEIQCKK